MIRSDLARTKKEQDEILGHWKDNQQQAAKDARLFRAFWGIPGIGALGLHCFTHYRRSHPMEDEDDADLISFVDDMDRALAVHEAGHAVVARALGADVLFVEIDLGTGDGGSRSSEFSDNIKNLAVCVAGCRAEHAFEATALRTTKKGDFRHMRKLLSRLPEAERHAARAEGYRLSDLILKANTDVVRRIADELLARRWIDSESVVRLEGDELRAMLSGTAASPSTEAARYG